MNRHKANTRKGFSLIEMMMVVFILAILVGAMFRQIDRAQTRYSVETRKLDLTQQNRDFIDQFTRDLHQAGYPSPVTYGNRVDLSSNLTAAGIWYISQTDLRMEADVDGTGVVEIAYHYDDGTAGGPNNCPCMKRASAPKAPNIMPWAQMPNPVYYAQVENIVPPVAGQPLFIAYSDSGAAIDLTTAKVLDSASLTAPTYQFLHTIRNVGIQFTTQAQGNDLDTKKSIQVTMSGMARVPSN
jgi:prepilin-type N-terminal cleavage/methylation domain-containing protein